MFYVHPVVIPESLLHTCSFVLHITIQQKQQQQQHIRLTLLYEFKLFLNKEKEQSWTNSLVWAGAVLKAQYVYALAVIIQHNEGMLRIYRQPHPCTNLFTLHCACMYGGLGRNEGIRCSSDVNEMGSSHGEHFRKNMKRCRKQDLPQAMQQCWYCKYIQKNYTSSFSVCISNSILLQIRSVLLKELSPSLLCFGLHYEEALEHMNVIPFRWN